MMLEQSSGVGPWLLNPSMVKLSATILSKTSPGVISYLSICTHMAGYSTFKFDLATPRSRLYSLPASCKQFLPL